MLTYYFRTVKDNELKVLSEVRTGVWVHAVAPTEEELERLVKDFALDEDILRDASDFYEVPRLERSQMVTYFFTRYPSRDQQQDNATAPILIILGESFVVTLTMREIPLFKPLIEGTDEVITTQKTKLFILLMNILTKSYDRELLRLQKAVNKDRAHLQSIGTKEIARLVNYETTLNSMIDALTPTNVCLQQLSTGTYLQLYKEDSDTMQDLTIANSQVMKSASAVLRTIQNIRSASEAIMTSQLNSALRFLTVLTILLTVPLVIASLYGMNVDLPFQDSKYIFLGLIGVNAVILTILVVIFRKNRWF